LFASALATAALVATACGGSSGGPSTTASCTNAAESQGVFKDHVLIAIVGDYTGPTAATQEPYMRGIQTYFKFANDHGGICGKQIQWQEGDDKYTVPGGQAAWKQFNDQTPVYMYFGNNNSSVQDSLQEQVRNGDTPVMAESTTANSLFPFNKNFYQVVETYELQAIEGLAYFNQKISTGGAKAKAACFSLTVASGTQYCNNIKKDVEADGGTFIKHWAIAPSAVDATPEATQIQASNPNVIFLHGSPNTAITLFKAMDKLGMKTPVIGIFAVISETVYTTAPKAVVQNFAGIHSYTPAYISGPGNDEMNAASKKYSVDQTVAQNFNFVNGWVAGKVFVAGARAGAKASGKVDHSSLRKGLDSLNNFDTSGQSANFTYSSTDHQGLKTARPYTFDFSKNQLVPIGNYSDYAQYFKP
jgi:ABC-type branched-subunit amino acid transport system substrate-binding protein